MSVNSLPPACGMCSGIVLIWPGKTAIFSELAALGDGIYPEAVQKIAAALGNPVRRDALIAEYQVFCAALAQEPHLLAYRNRDVAWLAAALPELPMPRKDYPATLPELPAVSSFITTDEINAAIASHGSGMAGGRYRIYEYFETHALRADRAAFLKQEYGIGGHAPALSGAQHSSEDHDSKGICFKKAGCENVSALLAQPCKAHWRIDGKPALSHRGRACPTG